MDYLWSPWRYKYLTGEETPGEPGHKECVFCAMARQGPIDPSPEEDRRLLIVHRSARCFVVLNKFPYTSGHLMVVPDQHAASLAEIDDALAGEIMSLTRTASRHIKSIYNPDGINVGMNIGSAAGAGVAGHIHMHVLPRWTGDANFMTTVGETRVLPEELTATWTRLSAAFREGPAPDKET